MDLRDGRARQSFLTCLEEACSSMDWRLYAWCLMGNHYHLCIETPHPNLVEGMRWLQSTFANRFNRFRKSNGHVFQGRYKAILLDGDAVGAVCFGAEGRGSGGLPQGGGVESRPGPSPSRTPPDALPLDCPELADGCAFLRAKSA